MTMPPRYTEFGYPLANLPLPGHAVTSLDVINPVEPLLHGPMAIIMALNTAFFKHDLTTEEGIAALSLIEGHLETALHILKRWRVEECASQDDHPQEKGTAHDRSL